VMLLVRRVIGDRERRAQIAEHLRDREVLQIKTSERTLGCSYD
jgi:hypothetical protein